VLDRFISTQFCDDIRQEVGNKLSLMGCYSATIQVERVPAVLPKLCAVVKVYTPLERPFTRLAVRIVRDEQTLAELRFPPENFAFAGDTSAGSRWQMVSAGLVMAPFHVESSCTLCVEAETEEGILHGGLTWINAAASAREGPPGSARQISG
jgi:hypothetical protein